MIQAHLQVIKQRTKHLLPRLKCAFHENETLTNFCSCSKCLLPLCPTCIKIHTIEHINMKTDPSYQNIYDMIVGLNVDIKQFILVNEQNHRLITQTQQKLYQFKDEIFANIDNLKKSLIDEIEKYFTQLLITTQQKIQHIPYIRDLTKHKTQLKKTILGLKKFQKQLNDDNVTGKFVVRNLIKYSAKNTSDILEKYDQQCKQFVSKVNGNYCQFQLKQNLKNDLMNFLGQAFRIKINQIPSMQQKDTQEMLGISQKLQQFIIQNSKGSQKSQMKNSLNKVMSKLSHPNNNINSNSNKFLNTSQASTIKHENRQSSKQTKPINVSELSRKIFDSTNKRSFNNHSSQRKSLHISSSFCQNQTSIMQVRDKQNRGMVTESNFHQRRSVSKGKGLSLIQPRQSIVDHQPRNLTMTQQIRFSLAEIENVNFDYDSIKSTFQFTPQHLRNKK